jgi:hypothetical protein
MKPGQALSVPDKKGKKLVNVNRIISIDWYTK